MIIFDQKSIHLHANDTVTTLEFNQKEQDFIRQLLEVAREKGRGEGFNAAIAKAQKRFDTMRYSLKGLKLTN
jgi:hypothetical protein